MNIKYPQYNDICLAHNRITSYIHKTPVLTSSFFDSTLGCEIYFKCENFQKVGAFKIRGAMNSLLSMNEEKLEFGVATHSSGNHAQALALAARTLGTKATIIMPVASPKAKSDAVAGYGADIIFCEPTLKAREEALAKYVAQSGAIFIHPYNKFEIIAGAGTAAKEIFDDIRNIDIIIAPIGGGGLISGTAIAAKANNSDCKVYAAEPIGADDAFRSFHSGIIQPSVNPQTIADGLLTSLGEMNFAVINDYLDDIITVSEDDIITTMRLVWERMKIIIEPSSATALAAIFAKPELFAGKKVAVIFSGGNVDLDKLPWMSK